MIVPLVLAVFTAAVHAGMIETRSAIEWNITACKTALDNLVIFAPDYAQWYDYKIACGTPQNLGSIVTCIYENMGVNNTEAENAFIGLCEKENIVMDHDIMHKAYQNASKYIIDLDTDTTFNYTEICYSPVKGSEILSYYSVFRLSLRVSTENSNSGHYLGAGSVAFWALLIVCSAICNWAKVLFPKLTQRMNGEFSQAVRKYIFLPAAFRKSHENAATVWGVAGLAPDRFESIVILLHTVYCILANALGYQYIKGDPYYSSSAQAISGYIGVRSGLILCYQCPLIFLFAGRNNIMQYFTRWSFSRFLVFHKWLARTMFLELIVHAAGYTNEYILGGYYADYVGYRFMVWGIVATVAGGIMLITGLYQLRCSSYEVFLLIHIAMATLFVAGSWIHCWWTATQVFFYVCTAVWCFDRFIRICRMGSYGIRDAKAELVAGETIRLILPKGVWCHFPGAYGFLHFMTPLTFLQSHPFTVNVNGDDVHIYCKVKGGVTSVMYKRLIQGPQNIKVCLEGPYGQKYPYDKYDSALLFAGGNGIPGLYDSAMDISKREKTNVKLYWIIREWKSINWFLEELQRLKGMKVKVVIYLSSPESLLEEVTVAASSDEDLTEKKDSSAANVKDLLSFVEFREGRPDVFKVLAQDIEESTGSVSVGACGHPAMCDDVRKAVSDLLGKAKGKVDYFEELLVW